MPLIVRWIPRVRSSDAAAISAQQLDLQVVERVEIRQPVADRARKRGAPASSCVPYCQHGASAVPFGADASEMLAQPASGTSSA